MIHLGDVTKISGHNVPVADVVIGGSPCQDLSVAGKRAGLAGARSGLFMEQIRVIKEMREADIRAGKPTFLIRPRFMVWENVPGAFSSNKGQDFRAVLEETIKIAEPGAPDVPLPANGKWPVADAWYGDTWSVAYRLFDAQFWGTPQRRRRIALVADFGGHAAPEILFVRRGLCGDFEEEPEERETAAGNAGDGAGEAVALRMRAGCDGGGKGALLQIKKSGTLGCANDQTIFCFATQQGGAEVRADDKAPTLTAAAGMSGNNQPVAAQVFENHGQDSRITGPLEVAPTVSQKYGTGGNNVPLVYQTTMRPHSADEAPTWKEATVANTVNTFDIGEARAKELVVMATGQAGAEICKDLSPTLNCDHEQPIVFGKEGSCSGEHATGGHYISEGGPAPTVRTKQAAGVMNNFIVRRLTPLECERLQGYPDGWTDIGEWVDSKGKLHKESSDSARYRALGNSIALPPWKWVLKRLCGCYEREATMASLFDGIGGFPLIWEQLNGAGSCLWASEIEEFPIAVTKRRFGD